MCALYRRKRCCGAARRMTAHLSTKMSPLFSCAPSCSFVRCFLYMWYAEPRRRTLCSWHWNRLMWWDTCTYQDFELLVVTSSVYWCTFWTECISVQQIYISDYKIQINQYLFSYMLLVISYSRIIGYEIFLCSGNCFILTSVSCIFLILLYSSFTLLCYSETMFRFPTINLILQNILVKT